MKTKNKYHEIWNKELKKRRPIYLIGEFFHIICSSLNLISGLIIGRILDLLLNGESKEEIFKQVFILMAVGNSIILDKRDLENKEY